MPGSLYLVATPIGNLDDITLRALHVLREEVALIACEDTRQTQKLLQHFEIRKPLVSYHEHNEMQRGAEILAALARGDSVALVSDAGTPLISDPGYRVVSEAIAHGIPVVPIPGASALLAALTASGLPVHEFRFAGFLPPKALARRKMLENLAHETMTIVAYESPHRILETLADMRELLANASIVLAREVTKVHEEFLRGSAAAILEIFEARGTVKGEITLIISPAQEVEAGEALEEVAKLTATGIERMEAIKIVAKRLGLPKREVYRLVTEPDSNRPDKHRG
ncbi:MAG TPA: 16S rRNA (cytidine(1402)-2'-O)-methyltransferase [Bryobacteraceae bacterium]